MKFKVVRTREVILYQDLEDPKVAEARIEIWTGRKQEALHELTISRAKIKEQ